MASGQAPNPKKPKQKPKEKAILPQRRKRKGREKHILIPVPVGKLNGEVKKEYDYKLWSVELKLNTLKKNLIYTPHQIGLIQTLINDLIMKLHETQYIYAFGQIAYRLKQVKIQDMPKLLNDLTKAINGFKSWNNIATPE